MGNKWRIRLLGPVQVEQNGVVVNGFVSRKAVALLGYLVAEAKPISRSYLAQLFWEDKSEARGRGNLSRVINNLTKLLPGCLRVDYHTVQLNLAAVDQIDTSSFKAYLAQGSLGDLVRAVMLYRGEFLADLNLLDCPEFDIWLSGERELWRRQAVQTLQQIIDHYLHRSEYNVAISFVSKLLDVNPWREESHRQMMMILARTGQRSAALSQYEICRRVLAEEFGVEPSAETADLYNRIKAVTLNPPHNLPAQPTPFMGRETELGRVTHHLSDPDCRLLTLIGSGGIGKTRLALQAAQQITQYHYVTFLHGVYFVALAPVQSVDFLASTIADTIGLLLSGAANPSTRLLDYLHHKEMLLILDNFEHLLDGVELVRQILEQAPDVKILTTSRTRLNLRWEWLFEVNGLQFQPTPANSSFSTAGLSQIGSIKHCSALALFEHIARRLKSDFAISDQNRTVVTRICQLVDGMPLGIELAASQIQAHSCEAIAQGIKQNLDFLTTSLRDVPARHRSLRAVFDYSWGLLTAEAQQAFRRLAIFEGGFNLNAAEQVAGASLRLLTVLINHSLLQPIASERYTMHDLVRLYGLEKLMAEFEEYEAAKASHGCYYLNYLHQTDVYHTRIHKTVMFHRDLEINNIRMAWGWAVEHGRVDELDNAGMSVFELYELRGWYHEALHMFDLALNQVKTLYDLAKVQKDFKESELSQMYGRFLAWQSWFTLRIGNFIQAQQSLHQALSFLAETNGSTQPSAAFPLYQLGLIDWYLGNYSEAKQYLTKALTISRNLNELMLQATTLLHLGLTAYTLGEYDEARRRHRECLTVCKELQEQSTLGIQFICLGRVEYVLKSYGKAKCLIEHGLTICQEVNHSFSVALAKSCLGLINWRMGNIEAARILCQDSLQLFTEMGEPYGIVLATNHLGQINWSTGKPKKSRQNFIEALQRAIENRILPQALASLVGLARHLAQIGQTLDTIILLLYVITHPAAEFETKARATDFLAELAPHYSLQMVAEATRQIENLDLETLVRRILKYEVR
ncbi:MAG: tetratricopeptide repeat protein [Anaerolineaceae bacterium]|nr:tetratricopeptide repeat protein [Anaerolineaceae bacterium]MCB9100290.1 tetratricopeptide repeat protein [Anaerolineales bacterium]